jgi:hypothetical protein
MPDDDTERSRPADPVIQSLDRVERAAGNQRVEERIKALEDRVDAMLGRLRDDINRVRDSVPRGGSSGEDD